MKFVAQFVVRFCFWGLWFSCGTATAFAAEGPVRVLFLGHEGEHHNSNEYYPMLAKALGPEAIYFDYLTDVEAAVGDATYLNRFDAILLYANHDGIESGEWTNLLAFVENGGGFLPIHCASACFANEPGFDQLVGGRFAHHKSGVFAPKTIAPEHPAVAGAPRLEAWDETYVHKNQNEQQRTVLQVREPAGPADNIREDEPWTWARTQGKGRVFYTASGHDERVWARSEFHALLKRGILWSIGDERRASYERFIAERAPLTYEERGNVPNYELRPKPLPYQFPLPAEDSLAYTQVPIGFRLELFASEPQIINPISMAWDARGRLWVAETVDYPNELTESRSGRDRIKILEDTNGDGRCDKVTVFAEGLNVPTSLTHVNGGVIVAHAPDFLFLKDSDGDDKADVREVLNTGWGVNDTHAGPSNLRYGFDNKIWGAVGYSGYNANGSRFGSGIFRMQPDGSDVTFLHQFNNNTWGLGFSGGGDVFGSTANNNPAFFCGFPATGFQKQKAMSAKMIADTGTFHPITPNIRQVDALGKYTAGAGYTLATSKNFPPAWRDRRAFISGPTGNLLGMYEHQPAGSGYTAENKFALIASADEWFSPVAAEVGPDGNLWVADWYNFIIQHNPSPTLQRGGYDAKRGKGNAHENPNRDKQHGRIYRLVWEGAKPSSIDSLDGASTAALVDALASDNLFWRLTAQRLLVEAGSAVEVAPLQAAVAAGGPAAVHALWSLHGLGKLDAPTHQRALLQSDPVLRRNAVEALGTNAAALQLFFDTAVVTDRDLSVRRAAFTKLAHFPVSDAIKGAVSRLRIDKANREDEWLKLALKAAADNQGVGHLDLVRDLGPNLIPNPSVEVGEGHAADGWRSVIYSGKGTFSVVTDPEVARSGARCLKLQSDGIDGSWSVDVPCKPNTEYRFSGWIKTRGVFGAMGALMNVHGIGKTVTAALKLHNDWTEVEVVFNSGGNSTLQLNCLMGGWGQSKGQIWWDDISLQEISHKDVETAKLAIVGDIDRGRILYLEHPVAACSRCHQIGGAGGVVGPRLDGIASRKEADYIRESLINPQANIAEGYPAEVSPMPPMGILLTPQELEDVMAFLMTLRK